ncbi:uncharacterized protein LOC135575309 isoform X2 [Columba livia]|uniref:uncharacterized protein LOC135575309 isoform X2 n=1 Tax=Columba livia TaxID=8932 RepID=UPI0031BBCA4F
MLVSAVSHGRWGEGGTRDCWLRDPISPWEGLICAIGCPGSRRQCSPLGRAWTSGPYEHGTLLGREVLLGPRMTHDQKQNRLGNLKIWRTEGICSQQSFSQILPPLYQFIRVLKKKLVPASPGDSYHSYDWFIPFASQSKFLLSLEGQTKGQTPAVCTHRQDPAHTECLYSAAVDFLGTTKPQPQDDMSCHWRGVSTLFYNPAHIKVMSGKN